MNVSFIHYGNESMASYRYRCQIPARETGASINDKRADVLVFTKPCPADVKAAGYWNTTRVFTVDFCDDHFDRPEYLWMAKHALAITCPTAEMQKIIVQKCHRASVVIPDPYEFPEIEPHCNGDNLMWFGHGVNIKSVYEHFDLPKLRIVSNVGSTIPWSHETMLREFARADIVIMPATATYKSPNRTVEAIRQGCFVVAEPHPSLTDIPGIWIGDIKEGIAWATQNRQEANHRTSLAQIYVRQVFSPERVGNAWKTLLTGLTSTLGAETSDGMALSM